jgi:hypothetical protein
MNQTYISETLSLKSGVKAFEGIYMRQSETSQRAREDDDHGLTVLMNLLRMLIVKNDYEPLSNPEWLLFQSVTDTLLQARKHATEEEEESAD